MLTQSSKGISTTVGVVVVIVLLVIGGAAYYYYTTTSTGGSSTTAISCGQGASQSTNTTQTTNSGNLPGKGFSVGVVFDVGGLGDRGFNDLAYAGMIQANQTLGVNYYYQVATSANDFPSIMDALIAKHVNLVVANGFDMTPAVNQSATQHPNQLYAIVDGDPPAMNKSNVIVLKWQEHLGSAVIGALSVAMTHSNKIAFLGAVPFSVLYKFWNGYRAGALWASQYLSKNVTILKQWAGTTFDYFDKPAAGVQIGQSFISSGADVIFTAAGGTGLGTFNAIGAYDQQQGWRWQTDTPPPVFGIGVDANQDYYGTCQFFYKHQNSTSFSGYTAPSFVLTSEVKKVDLGVYAAIKSVVYNNFSNVYQQPDKFAATFFNGQTKICGADGGQPCHARGVWLFGLASGSVGVTPFLYTSQYLTPTAKNVVNQITNGILNGTINIPEDYVHDTAP